MNSHKKIITHVQLLLLAFSVFAVHFICPMEGYTKKVSIMSSPTNNEVSIKTLDENTTIQIQYGTNEWGCGGYHVIGTTVPLQHAFHDQRFHVEKQLDKTSILLFIATNSEEKRMNIIAHDFDIFTIHPKENNIVKITKENKIYGIPAGTKVAIFKFKS